MSDLDPLIKAWDEAIWEYTLVFEGLDDEDVWKRPHPRILSIGELTGHLAYYEAVMTTEPAPNPAGDVSQIPIQSVLIDPTFKYFDSQVDAPVVLNLGAQELLSELKRIHEAAKSQLTKVEREASAHIVGKEKATWGAYVQYLGFHAAYHAGQAYSVRHLFGHKTTDN